MNSCIDLFIHSLSLYSFEHNKRYAEYGRRLQRQEMDAKEEVEHWKQLSRLPPVEHDCRPNIYAA